MTFLMWFTLIKVFYLTPIMMSICIVINSKFFKLKSDDTPPFIIVSVVPIINFVMTIVILIGTALTYLEEIREKYVG